jgi:hypothetical protein
MTISNPNRIAGPYISGTALAFTFKVFTAADLQVIRLNTTTGVETPMVLTTDYTVTLNGNQNTSPGGTVNMVVAASATSTVTITSNIDNLQPTDLTNQGGFYPEVITDSLDRATIQIQQISDIGDRTIKYPISDGPNLNMQLPTVANRASKYLTFDAAGLPTVSVGTGTDTALRTDLANNSVALAGSSLVGFRQSDATSVARTVLTKLRETKSVTDFGAVGDGVTDDTAAFNAAQTASTPNPVFVPAGSYAITGTVTGSFFTSGVVTIVGGTVTSISTYGTNATINGNITVSGTTTVANIAVNGAGITTTSTGTATVFNTNATTLNVGGAATTVSLGAATGTTTINNANTVVTGDLAVNGADITTTATGPANVFNTNATTLNVGGAATTLSLGATTGTASVNNATFQFNSGYGSVATAFGCRAWVNFNGQGTNNLSGTYSQSGTTVTVTATSHGLIAGNSINIDITSGTGVDGIYTVATVVDANTFTYTAGTSLTTSGNATLLRSSIRASGNVTSITDNGTGDYTVNFTNAMPDVNYAVVGSVVSASAAASVQITTNATGSVRFITSSSSGVFDSTQVSIVVFR